MIIIERMVQEIDQEKWVDLEVLDKKYNAIEARLGFPPKKRLQQIMGMNPMGTLIIEREWPSMAAFEEAEQKGLTDPEYMALRQESASIIKNVHWEMYMPLP